MRWVEIISVRLSRGKDVPMIQDIFRNIPRSGTGTGVSIDAALYVDTRVETDWSIHICRDSKKNLAQKSNLGLVLAEEFRSFGLVNHSVWEGQ